VGPGVVFAAVGTLAASIALGAAPDADGTARVASRGILAMTGGLLVLPPSEWHRGGRCGLRRDGRALGAHVHPAIRRRLVAARWARGLHRQGAARWDPRRSARSWPPCTRMPPRGRADSAVDGLLTLPAGRAIAVALGIG
jgi:hypothetical protein